MKDYVIVTAARNEEKYIEKTLDSVVAQTHKPICWIIVSDGSTDRTDEIVLEYQEKYPFIRLIRSQGDAQRNFGSKALAVNYGYEQLADLDFEFVGNLDADVSFEPDYYKVALSKFEIDPDLGLVGGRRFDKCDTGFRPVDCAENSVGGPFQLFRRECFEAIEGYMVLPYGGVDAVAEISLRKLGWKVQSFKDIEVYHHRRTGGEGGKPFRACFRSGIKEYVIGYHPLFTVSRALRRFQQSPFILSSLVWIAGYFWAAANRFRRPVPDDFVSFLRSEQAGRFVDSFKGRARLNGNR